jgi:hypothetical protein
MKQTLEKEVIPGASTRAHYSQEVLKPRGSGGLGKARIPESLDEAGEDRLGNGLLAVNSFQLPSFPSSGKFLNLPSFQHSSPDLHIWAQLPA